MFPTSSQHAAGKKMLRMSADARTLSRHEIYGLLRGGLVLAITVALALTVPPKVWGVGDGNSTPTVEMSGK